MPIPKRLLNFLEKNKVEYKIEEHKKVYTALDAAETQKIKPQKMVKTLVMKLDRDYIIALVPANKNLDKNKLKKLINDWVKKQGLKIYKKIDFAKEAWMKKNILGKVGASPPFGSLIKLPVFMDRALTRTRDLIVNSGEYTKSIKLKTNTFIKLEKPIIGSFSKAKK